MSSLTTTAWLSAWVRDKAGGAGVGLPGEGSSLYPPLWSLTPGQMRSSQACDPQGLCTLFLEMLFKLMQQGFVPYKSAQEVMRWAHCIQLQNPGCGEQTASGRGSLMFLP